MNQADTMPASTDVTPDSDRLTTEDSIVAELEQLDIRYLSRQSIDAGAQGRPPATLLADLMRQPSARVREAVIAVLLAHPVYAQAVPAALAQLSAPEQLALRFFYSASVLLQRQYADVLRPHVAERWQWLPDLYSQELGIATQGTPQERLGRLGAAHRAYTRSAINWTGTYDNVARKLVRRWSLEHRWNR
ncbi:MAG: hypothetical protein CVU38_14385 [Chloroflexi bacterium HGW-Chloroflexi-1]|nr:MAG: hypothetical protein CVU38_14385 [Chloroflexi bacterium HGW-Chloroflexi-1]